METPPQPPQKPRFQLFWWLIFIGLLAWNAWLLLMPKSKPSLDISYSAFIDQVKQGNVSEVTLKSDQIDGSFINPILPPLTTPKAGASPTQISPTPATTPVAPLFQLGSAGTTTESYSNFHVVFPETQGDPNLLPLLEQHKVQIDVSQPASPWLALLVSNGLPFILLVLVMIWMGRQASQNQNGIFSFGRSKPRRYNPEQPQVTFEDVAGVDESKQELQEVIDFLRQPQKYHDIGARVPRGVLLVGPPGTGKTLLARAVAGEAGVPFFSISASEFVEMFVGVGASRVRTLFEQAKADAPAIVYIDELDAVGRRRGAGLGTVNDEREQTLNQLLVEMDGFDERHEIIVLASTNRPDVLDPALLRPGRFDRQITVALPDRIGREGILSIHTRNLRLAADVDLHIIAQTTTGFSGADLANLCNEAALIAARNGHPMVTMDDFEAALDRLLLGAARTLLLNDHERQVVAYHEAGHALVAWLTPNADLVHKVTIIPHGRALGVTEQLPGDDHYNYSKEYLMARISVMLGGRAAEEIAVDDVTTGAENDLVEATRLAKRMVTRWGMGSLGPMAINTDDEQPFLGYELTQGKDYSEETAAQIDQDIQNMLRTCYIATKNLLQKHSKDLDNLAHALLKEETVDQEEMKHILGERILVDVFH
jgi:cell division protease FtsH